MDTHRLPAVPYVGGHHATFWVEVERFGIRWKFGNVCFKTFDQTQRISRPGKHKTSQVFFVWVIQVFVVFCFRIECQADMQSDRERQGYHALMSRGSGMQAQGRMQNRKR